MMQEVLAAVVMGLFSLLIVFKSDQQSIVILKGRLFQAGMNHDRANLTYKKHANISSIIFFMLGFALLAVAVVNFANGGSIFVPCSVVGLPLLLLGIWGRISSFRAAAQEIDAAGEALGKRDGGGSGK